MACRVATDHLIVSGIFTGTAGVLLLFGIQFVGFFCVCCIGAAYLAAGMGLSAAELQPAGAPLPDAVSQRRRVLPALGPRA